MNDGDLIDIQDDLDTEDLDQARSMTGSQRLRAGGDLFDEACRWTLAGIRRDCPGISEEAALEELRKRIAVDSVRENPP